MATNEELDIASKLLDSLREVGKRRNKSYRYVLGFSAFLIFQFSDWIKFEEKVSLQWFNVEFESYVFTIITSLLLVFFHQNCLSLITYGDALEKKVFKVYKSVLGESEIIKKKYVKFLDFPDPIETFSGTKLFRNNLIGRIYLFLIMLFTLIVLPILPIIAIGLSSWKLYGIMGEPVWLMVSYFGILIIQIVFIVSFYIEMSKN